MPRQRVLLIGWDAADWKVINPLMEAGKMPNVQRLVENGSMAQIATLHPPLSPMLWTSIATGKRPFKHGILGFSEPTQDGRGVQPITNLSRKSKAVWNILQQNGLRSIVIGWWPSHPAEPISGVMVSDHYHRAFGPLDKGWPLRRGAVHPAALEETLAELRMHPQELAPEMMKAFIPHAETIDQTKDGRLLGMCKTLCECVSIHSAATWLIDNQPWDFFAVYYDAIDHFCHGFMKYHPPKQPWISDADFELYSGVVSTAYQFHDQMLGTLLRSAGNDVRVILMSDHGFHPDHLRPRAIPDIPAGPAIEHRDFGILVMSGDGIRKDELIHGASVLDITPTLLAMYGLPVGKDMDGKVLTAAFEGPEEVESIPSWDDVPGDDGRHPPDTRLDPVAAKEALDQLVALGYIDRPDENAEVAVAKTIQELRYNQCEALQDAALHAEALEIARDLHKNDPDEQRFAVKRFVSCQALDYVDEMRTVVEDLDGRRRALFQEAVGKVDAFRKLATERFGERAAAEGKTVTQEDIDAAVRIEFFGDPQVGPPVPPEEKPAPLFNAEEKADLAKWRNLARFQPPVVDYLKAQVLTADRQWFAALECLGRVRQAHLARPALFLQSAELYGRLNRWEEAAETYTKALELDPDNPHAHLGMCRVYLRRRDYSSAAQSALDCLQRLYQFPMAHFLLGVALAGARDYKRSAEALRVAVRLNPNFPQAHIRLAWLLKHKLKDPAGAETHLQLYRETRLRRIRASRRQSDGADSVSQVTAPVSPADTATPVPDPASQANGVPRTALPPVGNGIVVVCGLPRSGTSMIMQMLAAGGMPILTDSAREPDEDNPLGYFEFEPVKQARGYQEWIGQAAGKAIKVVAPLISFLPARPGYRVILIERDLDEVLASQSRMIARRGEKVDETPERSERLLREYARLMERVKTFLTGQPGIECLILRHSTVIRDPAAAAHSIDYFCGAGLNELEMAACVRPELHRQRHIGRDALKAN
jgi:predicted AlkP superfamily phosphohydrolase/phosphomutase/tetratricopeptide (TPR) repeat protein